MSSSNLSISDMQHAVRDTVRHHWQLFLTQGVIMTILGVLAVIWPQISTVAVDVYVGWLFLLSGVVGLATMFLAQDVQAFLWLLLTAALSLFVGIVLLWHPVEGAVSLTLVLIAFFIVEGIFQIAASISYRDVFPDSWGWMLASGIAGTHRRRQSSHIRRSNHHGGARRPKCRESDRERRRLIVQVAT
jgi:uncharacterized membrane protein HdeD (DUF308 family)